GRKQSFLRLGLQWKTQALHVGPAGLNPPDRRSASRLLRFSGSLTMSFSVLMSIYHAEHPDHLRQALQSLLDQTLKADEVILVEDGPLPAVLTMIIESFRASLNINSIRLATNGGLAVAL